MEEKVRRIRLNHNATPCKVPKVVRAKWREMFRHGDISRINRSIGCSRRVISEAINNGLAQPELQEAITGFFAERKAAEKEQERRSEEKQLKALGE